MWMTEKERNQKLYLFRKVNRLKEDSVLLGKNLLFSEAISQYLWKENCEQPE